MLIPRKFLAVLLGLWCAVGLARSAEAAPAPNFASTDFKPTAGWTRKDKSVFVNTAKSMTATFTATDARYVPEVAARQFAESLGVPVEFVKSYEDGQAATFQIKAVEPGKPAQETLVMFQNYGTNPERQLKVVAQWPDTATGTSAEDISDLFFDVMENLKKGRAYSLHTFFNTGEFAGRVYEESNNVTKLTQAAIGGTYTVTHDTWHGPLAGAAERQKRLELTATTATECTPVKLSADGLTATFYTVDANGRSGWAFKLVPMPGSQLRSGVMLSFHGTWPSTTDAEAAATFEKLVKSSRATFGK